MDFLANPGQLSFFELANWWLEKYAEKNLDERTIERLYQFTERTYHAIGEIPIKDIKVMHIQMFVDSLGEAGVNRRTGGGLSPKTIRGYMNFISDVMRYAWRLELIDSNPCERVILPPLQKSEPKIYTEEQTGEFLFHLRDAPLKYHVFYAVAIYTGLRRGELLGLDWNDIDFENHIIFIRRNSQYTKRKGLYSKKPKTRAGERILKLPEILFGFINCLKREQLVQCKCAGIKWNESIRLFTGTVGQPMHPNTPYNWLKRFCADKGLPFYGIHQFRHLNASLLIYTGADPTTVSRALGHTQVSTTLNIYSHAFAYAQAKASHAVGRHIEARICALEPKQYY